MATTSARSSLSVRVLVDSGECGVFIVSVSCDDPGLLRFWRGKRPFHNGQVEQTDVSLPVGAGSGLGSGSGLGLGLDFVLRALHREPELPNSHYWTPFVLSLCLDALGFHFRLPARALLGGGIQSIMEEGALTLFR